MTNREEFNNLCNIDFISRIREIAFMPSFDFVNWDAWLSSDEKEIQYYGDDAFYQCGSSWIPCAVIADRDIDGDKYKMIVDKRTGFIKNVKPDKIGNITISTVCDSNENLSIIEDKQEQVSQQKQENSVTVAKVNDYPTDISEVARQLLEARIAKGMSVSKLSRELSVDAKTIRNWEGGIHMPKERYFKPIKNVLGVSLCSNEYLEKIGKDDKPNGNVIKRARLALGMSPKEFAAKLSVSPTSIYMWEAGKTKPSHRKLSALARLTGVPIKELRDELELGISNEKQKTVTSSPYFDTERFGRDVKRAREDAGFTVDEFDSFMGFEFQETGSIEYGKTRYSDEINKRVAKVLSLDFENYIQPSEQAV